MLTLRMTVSSKLIFRFPFFPSSPLCFMADFRWWNSGWDELLPLPKAFADVIELIFCFSFSTSDSGVPSSGEADGSELFEWKFVTADVGAVDAGVCDGEADVGDVGEVEDEESSGRVSGDFEKKFKERDWWLPFEFPCEEF